MATFVGAEYIIANLLIAMKRNRIQDSISLKDLGSAGVDIQKMSLEEGINAIFLSSSDQLSTAIFDFSDYFEYDGTTDSIRVVETKKISDLENRFMGYLPIKVLTFLAEASTKVVLKQFE